jgi:hypothetical protein
MTTIPLIVLWLEIFLVNDVSACKQLLAILFLYIRNNIENITYKDNITSGLGKNQSTNITNNINLSQAISFS